MKNKSGGEYAGNLWNLFIKLELSLLAMFKSLCTFNFFFLLVNCLVAQQTITGFKRINKADGVPNSGINNIFEASDHFLWLATESGLYKFDGFQSTPFYSNSKDSTTLSSNVIADIEEDRFGDLWVATFGKGVNRYNKKKGKWKRYIHPTKDENPFYWVFNLFKDSSGQLWLGTNGRGLLLYDEKSDSFQQFIPDTTKNKTGSVRFENEIRAITADKFNPSILWLAGTDGLYRFDTKTKNFTCYKNVKNNKAEWINNSFHSIFAQDKQNIWLGAWGGGLIHFNTTNATFTNYPPYAQEYAKHNLSRNIISSIAYCSDSSLYIGTLNDGLFEFNLRNHNFNKINKSQSTNKKNDSDEFYQVTHTSDGSTWVCSSGNIFQKHPVYERLGQFQSFYQPTEKYVYKPTLTGLLYRKDSKEYWMSCNAGHGVYVYDNSFNYLRSVAIENNATDKKLREIVLDASGTTWLLSKDFPYLYYYDKTKDRFLNAAPIFKDNAFISSGLMVMATDKKGNVWWVNSKQLLKWDPLIKRLQSFLISDSVIETANYSLQVFKLIFDANDNPWLAGNTGMCYFNQSNESWNHFISGPVIKQSLANTFVESFAFDKKGNCWIAPSDEGLQLYNPSSKIFIKQYIQSEGFFETTVHDLVADVNGDLWIFGNNGLARYDVKQDQWFRFNTEDGLAEAKFFGSLFPVDDGTMILSVQNGFTHWNINSLPLNSQKPIVYFNRFVSGGKELVMEDNRILLPSSANELSIDFSAISIVMGNRTKFYYKILPLQKEWTAIAQRSLSLAGITSGSYTLAVKAVNSDGVESDVKEFTITVAYPFWKTWWFILFTPLAVAALLYWLYRYRVQQLLKMQQMRNSISRDLHDEIGSSVSSINMLSMVAKIKLGDEHPVTPLLKQIGLSAQNAGDSINDIIWSIHPQNDSIERIVLHMKELAAEMLEPNEIAYQLDFDNQLTQLDIPMQDRRHLFLLYKEALNNIIKYAGCKNSFLSLHVVNKNLVMKIEDDGIGFDKAKHKPGNGLINMQQRADEMKAELVIATSPGKGCCITLRYPLK